MQYESCYGKRKMAVWKPIRFVRRNSCWPTETKCKKQKQDLNEHKRGWMSGKNGQMKENSILNWRSTTRKISIKSTKDGFFYNFVENIINKRSYDRSCISWYMVTRDIFKVLRIALACGPCNFEKIKNNTRARISRNAPAFIRFSIPIYSR